MGLSLDCLKFIIPGGKLSLHCKYTDCFIYNFIGCLDPPLLSRLRNSDLQAGSWRTPSVHFCIN